MEITIQNQILSPRDSSVKSKIPRLKYMSPRPQLPQKVNEKENVPSLFLKDDSNAELDLNKLKSHLNEMKTSLKNKVTAAKKKWETEKLHNDDFVTKLNEDKAKFRLELTKLAETKEKREEKCSEEISERNLMENEIENLAMKEHALPLIVADLKKTKSEQAKLLCNKKKEALLFDQTRIQDYNTTHLQVSTFNKRLGLTFIINDVSVLVFIFTLIDPADPEKEFTFTLNVLDNAYSVTSCDPELPNVESDVAALNQSDNWTVFMVAMRNSFKNLIR